LTVQPYPGLALLHVTPQVVSTLLEILLGGAAQGSPALNRPVTEIEMDVLDGVVRLLTQQLRECWQEADFRSVRWEKDSDLIQLMAPNEGLVLLPFEISMGESAGPITLALPALVVHTLRHRFERCWSAPRVPSAEADQARMFELLQQANLEIEVRLEGPTVLLKDLMQLSEGTVLRLEYPVGELLNGVANGQRKFRGQPVSTGGKKAFLVEEIAPGTAA
jgi:flagellar motor switch protein FliM